MFSSTETSVGINWPVLGHSVTLWQQHKRAPKQEVSKDWFTGPQEDERFKADAQTCFLLNTCTSMQLDPIFLHCSVGRPLFTSSSFFLSFLLTLLGVLCSQDSPSSSLYHFQHLLSLTCFFIISPLFSLLQGPKFEYFEDVHVVWTWNFSITFYSLFIGSNKKFQRT